MAVSEQTPYKEYTANGSANSFALEFDCENQDHLIVLVDDVEPVVGTWSLSDGAVVFGTAPINGKKITIQRNTPFRRDGDFQSYDNSFRPGSVNKGFDKTWWKIQELGVADWLLRLKLQKFRDDVNLTALENTLEEAKQIRDETADSVIEVQSNVEQSQTLLANTTAQSNLAQGYASSADSANTAAQQAAINVSDAESNVYSALSAQQVAVDTALSNLSTTANKYYSTLDAANADIANIALNQSVTIGEEANSGLWEKKTVGATSLTKSPYDPLTQSKTYADQKATALDVKLLENEKTTFGEYANYADKSIGGYIAKTTGLLISNIAWNATDYIPVTSSTLIDKYGVLIGSASSAAVVAFYDVNKTFLGYYDDTTADFKITASQLYANTKYVRLSYQNNSSSIINVREKNLFIDDFFVSGETFNGYIKLDGSFVQSGTWKTTDFIPCKSGQAFNYSGRGNVATVSNVSLWDKDYKFLGSLYAATGPSSAKITINNANAVYVRASGATAYAYGFVGLTIAKNKVKQYSTIVPAEVYALKNEPVYLYADGIVGNADNVAWNISESNQKVCKVIPITSASIPVQLQTTEDMNAKKTLASFNVVVTDTPVNPAAKRYIIALGDSLTDGTANSSIQGAWPNECSRRLNGVGFQILPAELSPAPLAMNNLEFIGTRGDKIVKHEGRGGWRASHYLNNASVTTQTNAFWNPATSQFDMSYYLTQNGFTGVNATGSNLTVAILLGWNDVYNSTAKQGATDLGLLIDKIRSTHPNTDIICLGLNQAPDMNFKSFTGSRFLSKREIFESVKQFNDEYKAMIATKTNVDFLQISCVFNSEISYNKADFEISSRSSQVISGVADHVHPNATGYAMLADAVFYKLLYKYCRT